MTKKATTGLENAVKTFEDELTEYATNYQNLLKRVRRTRRGSDRYYELNGEIDAHIAHIAMLAESLYELRTQHLEALEAEDELEMLKIS